ncbi:MarR family winged helix-turn-helix transcriptional regulator [Thermophilibacter immobilis]|nr:MarR family transcriptional regulator [Thermophilibacter immobilis]
MSSEERPRGRSLADFHMRLYRAFHAQRAYLRPRIARLGMGPGQPKLLTYIAVYGPSTQREIADFFETDPATVSRMLDSLERAGFAQSVPTSDRRTKCLRLTDKGLAAAAAWDLCCDEEQDVMLEGFSPDERGHFARYLERAYANLRRATRGGERS